MTKENFDPQPVLKHLTVYCQADEVLDFHKDQVLLVNAIGSLPESDFQFVKVVEAS